MESGRDAWSVFIGKAAALRARARQWHPDAVVHEVQSIQGEYNVHITSGGLSNGPGSSPFLLHKYRPRRKCEPGPGTRQIKFLYALLLYLCRQIEPGVSADGLKHAARPAESPPAAVAGTVQKHPAHAFYRLAAKQRRLY